MKILAAIGLSLALSLIGAAPARDLSYPPAGETARIIRPDLGERNRAAELDPLRVPQAGPTEPGHVIIDRNFHAGPPRDPAPSTANDAPREREFSDRGAVGGSTRATLSAAEMQRGILWRIDGGGARASYLFGTMHVEDPRVLDLPAPVRRAFEASDSVVVEADLNTLDLSVGSRLLYLDGRTLRDATGDALYTKVTELLAGHGIPAQFARLLRPWAAALLVSQPPLKTGMVLDRKLFIEAQQQGKAVHALESIEEQLSIFDSLSETDQVTLLREAVRYAERLPELFEEMVRAYLDSDLGRIQSLADRYRSGHRLEETLRERLIDERNRTMLARMQVRLEEGGAFVAVGALHLPGESGLLRLLAAEGYQLTAVH